MNFVLALAFLLIRPFVAQAFYIPSESMENTLRKHDRLVVNKFQYRFQEPQRRQVMVFNAPYEATHGQDHDYIKRLIGLPNETIEVHAAKIKIGGEELNPSLQGFGHDPRVPEAEARPRLDERLDQALRRSFANQ